MKQKKILEGEKTISRLHTLNYCSLFLSCVSDWKSGDCSFFSHLWNRVKWFPGKKNKYCPLSLFFFFFFWRIYFFHVKKTKTFQLYVLSNQVKTNVSQEQKSFCHVCNRTLNTFLGDTFFFICEINWKKLFQGFYKLLFIKKTKIFKIILFVHV